MTEGSQHPHWQVSGSDMPLFVVDAAPRPALAHELPPAWSPMNPPTPLTDGSRYALEVGVGLFWPEQRDLERIFSEDADSRILSEPAPSVEMTVRKLLSHSEYEDARLTLFLSSPKTLPTLDSNGGHDGVLAAALVGFNDRCQDDHT